VKERGYYHFDVLNENCPSRRLLELISDKWSVLIIEVLSHGAIRYNEIKRQIGGISDKMLAQTLRKLEDNKLITRTVYPEVPPRVEYSLSERGKTLVEPLHTLVVWAYKNQEALIQEMESEE